MEWNNGVYFRVRKIPQAIKDTKFQTHFFMTAPAAGRLQNEARLQQHTHRSVEQTQQCYGDEPSRPFGLRPSRPATALRL